MGAFTAVNRRAHTQATAYTIPADKVVQACKLAVKLPVPEKTNFWVSVSPGASCKYINTIAKRLAALNPGTVQAKWKSALDAAASNDNDNAMAAGNTLLYVHYVISMCHCPPPTWPDGVFVTSDGFAGPAAHIATAGKTLADTISSGVAAAIAVAQVALDEATALKPAVGAAPGDVGPSLEAQMQAAVAAQDFTLAASLLAQLQGQPATVAATPAKSLEAQVQEAAAKGDFTLVASLIAQISAQGAGAGANLDPAATVGGGGGAMSHENQVLALDRQIATASSAKQFAEALRLQKKQSDLRLVIGWEASKTQAVAESRFQDAAAFAHKIDLTLNPGTAEDDRLPRLRADLESAASAADYASCQRLSLEIAAIEGGLPSTAPAPGAGAESVAAVLAQMQSEIASLQSLKSLKRAVAPEVTITGTLPTAGSQDAGLQAALAASMLQGGGAVGRAPVSQAVMTADDMYFQGELPPHLVERVKVGKPVDFGRIVVAMAPGAAVGSSGKVLTMDGKKLKLVDDDSDTSGAALLDQLSFMDWDMAANAWAQAVQRWRPADYAGVMIHLHRCRKFASLFKSGGYKKYHRKVAGLHWQCLQMPGRVFNWAAECQMARTEAFATATLRRCTLCTGDHDTWQHTDAMAGRLPPPAFTAAPAGGLGVCFDHNAGKCHKKGCTFRHVCRSCGAADHIHSDRKCPNYEAFLALPAHKGK